MVLVLTTMGLLAFAPAPLTRTTSHRRAARLPCPTLEFGDSYYEGALEPLPEGVYEVAIKTPLGIQFEEDGPIIGKSGVSVIALVDGGNAAKGTSIYANSGGTNMGKEGKVEVGDKLVGTTAVKFQGAKWERQMFDCRKWDFETVVDAIKSNKEQFYCYDVILQLKRSEGATE